MQLIQLIRGLARTSDLGERGAPTIPEKMIEILVFYAAAMNVVTHLGKRALRRLLKYGLLLAFSIDHSIGQRAFHS